MTVKTRRHNLRVAERFSEVTSYENDIKITTDIVSSDRRR